MNQLITNNLAIWTTAPNGIKKLRELILELAVRGLLVPQDTNDEPASELLKKIAAEKARLVSEGKIKPPKPLAKISEEEKPFDLPESWEFVRFGEITHQITDGAHHTPTYVPEGVPFLSVKDVSSGVLKFENTRFISQEQHNELTKRCNPKCGDLLLTKVGTTGIPILIETEKPFSIFVSVALIKFDNTKTSGNYLSLLIKSPFLKYQSEEGTEGVGNKNLVLRKISSFILMIPPLAEQHRIVAKADELMQLCDQLEQKQNGNQQTHRQLVSTLLTTLTEAADVQAFQSTWSHIAANFDCLFTTESGIEQLKQTILQLAVMGKLVPQNPNDEPASALLKKIATEKARLIAEGKIKKQNPLPKISEEEKPFALPNGWVWSRLPEIGELARGKSKHRPRNAPILYSDGNIPLVQTGDVSRSNRTIKTYTALYNETGLKQSRLWKKGTMCITIAANIADTGILGFDACFPDSIVGFVPLDDNLNIGYFEYFLRTAKSHLEDFAPSTAQKNINLEILNSLLIPLPPSKELNRIVAKVDELMTLCEQLKTRLATAQTLQQQLAETLVQQAVV